MHKGIKQQPMKQLKTTRCQIMWKSRSKTQVKCSHLPGHAQESNTRCGQEAVHVLDPSNDWRTTAWANQGDRFRSEGLALKTAQAAIKITNCTGCLEDPDLTTYSNHVHFDRRGWKVSCSSYLFASDQTWANNGAAIHVYSRKNLEVEKQVDQDCISISPISRQFSSYSWLLALQSVAIRAIELRDLRIVWIRF